MIYFTGFNPSPLVRLPQAVFTDLLPIVDDLGELKATLAVLSLLSKKPGTNKCVRLDDLLDHPALAGMGEAGVIEGLSKAVIRGTLLTVRAWHANGQAQDLYFANTERGRDAVAAIERGEWPDGLDAAPQQAQVQRPNIFVLYEQCVGSIASPVLADDLRDAEATYPPDWIEEAFREAARQNARNWAYVRKILENRDHHEKTGYGRNGDVSAEWASFLRGER